METNLKLNRIDPRSLDDRDDRARSQSHVRMRVVRGDAAAPETFVLEAPSIQVVFQHDGLPRRVEWRCADSAGEDCCPTDDPRTRGETSISLSFEDPEALKTTVQLAGLVVADSGGRQPRRIEPYQLTNVLNLGHAFSTTDRSVVSYRIFDRHGSPAGVGMTNVAGSFQADSSLHLFFRYTDEDRRPGRISVFADV